jgi:hypothetical protein
MRYSPTDDQVFIVSGTGCGKELARTSSSLNGWMGFPSFTWRATRKSLCLGRLVVPRREPLETRPNRWALVPIVGRSSGMGLGCAKTILFGRNGERRTNFCVFSLWARPQASKFRVRLYRGEFSHRLGHFETLQRVVAATGPPSIADHGAAASGARRRHFLFGHAIQD